MTIVDGVTIVSALLLTGLLAWFFFGPKKTRQAEMEEGVQLVRVSVKGGYSPNVIEVRAGVPVRMLFDRQEAGDCSSRVVMPDFKVNELLPAYATTAVEFVPSEVGDFRFACGMNMISGTVHVVGSGAEAAQMRGAATNGTAVALLERGGREGYGGGGDVLHIDHSPGQHSDNHGAGVSEEANGRGAAVASEAGAADAGDAEAAERDAEIKDLTRRVILGAILTAPVLFAVMLTEFFGVTWVPELLMNRWFQLVLIAPVMFYTGWPIHRTGWLALSHRTADMNSLITLGTVAAFGYSLVVTFLPTILPANVREVYYEAVGVIITLILLGRLLETKAKAGTGEAIRTLIGLQPRTARVVRDGAESEVPIDDVRRRRHRGGAPRREAAGRRAGARGQFRR